MKAAIKITLVFLFYSNFIFSQTNTTINDTNASKTYKSTWIGKSFLDDQKHIWTAPFKIKGKDLSLLIPAAILTTGCIIYDEDIHQHITKYRDQNNWVKNLSPVLSNGGEIPFMAGITGGIYIGGLIFKNDKAMQTAAMAGYALVNSAVVVSVLKMLAGRQRPRVNGTSEWNGFPASLKQFSGNSADLYTSFPSGHSIAAWTLASVIAEQYKDTKIIPIIAYTFATGVALSRTTENAHWLSDVFVGSLLGYGIGKYIAKKHGQTNWVLIPSESGGYLCITGIYKFK